MSLVNKIIVGTRGSRLSLAQAEHFKDELLLANKNLKPTDVKHLEINLKQRTFL